MGAHGGVVVKALRYKPAGHGFDSRFLLNMWSGDELWPGNCANTNTVCAAWALEWITFKKNVLKDWVLQRRDVVLLGERFMMFHRTVQTAPSTTTAVRSFKLSVSAHPMISHHHHHLLYSINPSLCTDTNGCGTCHGGIYNIVKYNHYT